MKTLTEYLANEAADPRAKAIMGQIESDLRPTGTLEIFFAAEIVRALLRLDTEPDTTLTNRARITNEIRRNTAELRRLRADRLRETPQPPIIPEPVADSQNEPNPVPATTARNALCPCGSGRKYKRCCGKDAPPQYNLSPQRDRAA